MINLDVMMSRLQGYQLAKTLHAYQLPTPILKLPANDYVQDIVMGVDLQ